MPILLREAIGDRLRHARTSQRRTLRDISRVARVSLGYLSEVERGQKEASSELLAAICEALQLSMPELLRNVAADMSALRGVEQADAVPLAERRAAAQQGARVAGRQEAVSGSGMVGGGRLVTGRLGDQLADFHPEQAVVADPYDTALRASYDTGLRAPTGVVVAA